MSPYNRIASFASLCFSYFIAAVVALHFLRPDYNPISHHMSGYVLGPYGFLMTSAFFALSLGSLFLAVALWQAMPSSSRSKAGLIFLIVFGVGVAIAGIFPTDPDGAPITESGEIHELAFLLSSLCLIFALILLSRSFQIEEAWRGYGRFAMIIALLAFAAFLGFFAIAETEFVGLGQRILVSLFLLWLLMTTLQLRSGKGKPAVM